MYALVQFLIQSLFISGIYLPLAPCSHNFSQRDAEHLQFIYRQKECRDSQKHKNLTPYFLIDDSCTCLKQVNCCELWLYEKQNTYLSALHPEM